MKKQGLIVHLHGWKSKILRVMRNHDAVPDFAVCIAGIGTTAN